MKRTLILLMFAVPSVFAQSSEQFKKDSAALAEKYELLKLKNTLTTEENKFSDAAKIADEEKKKAEVTAEEAARVTKLEETNALIAALSAKKPASLTGNVTISESSYGTAESLALIHESLNSLAMDIGDASSQFCLSPKGIIIYKATYFQAFPSYYSLLNELKYLKGLYERLTSNVTYSASNNVASGIAIGSASIEAIAGLLSIFKTETSIGINDVPLSESMLISKLFLKNKCNSKVEVYYPEVYPLVPTKDSPLLVALKELQDARQKVKEAIDKNNKDNVKPVLDDIDKLEKSITDLDNKIKGEKKLAIKGQLEEQKKAIKLKLEGELKNKKALTDIEELYKNREAYLNNVFDLVYKNLMDRKEGNISLYQRLAELEGVLEKIDAGANVLKIEAKAKGTTKITKFLWASSLKHSAFVELDYQLYGKDGVLIEAKSLTKFTPFKKSSEISSEKNQSRGNS